MYMHMKGTFLLSQYLLLRDKIIYSFFKIRSVNSICKGWGKEAGRPHRSFWTRFYRHIQDFWNVVDLLSYLLLTIALCVRHAYPDQTYTFARHVFGLSLIAMYLRILEVVLIFRVLGPTLIVIKEMVLVFS